MNKIKSGAFVPFDFKLARQLKAEAFFLFYAMRYYENLGNENLCYASDGRLMRDLRIRDRHTLNKYKNQLYDLGLIIRHTRPHKQNQFTTCIDPGPGKGLRAEFILNPIYSARQKMVMAMRAILPGSSARDIARRTTICKTVVAATLAGHCPVYGAIFTNPLVKAGQKGRPFFNCKVSGISHTMYLTKYQEIKLTPEINEESGPARPVHDSESIIKAFSDLERQAVLNKLKELGIKEDRITFVQSVLERHQDEPLEKLLQACFVVFRKEQRAAIRISRYNYFRGIISNNTEERLIKGERATQETLENISIVQERRARVKASKIRIEIKNRCAESTEKENWEFWESLSDIEQEIFKPALYKIAGGGPFIKQWSEEMIIKIALAAPDFKNKLAVADTGPPGRILTGHT